VPGEKPGFVYNARLRRAKRSSKHLYGGAEPRLTSGGRADLKDGQESKKVFVTQIAPEQGNLGLLRIERYYL